MVKPLLLALFLAFVPSTASAFCEGEGLVPKVVTAANAELPLDGGIVVAAVLDALAPLTTGDPAVQPWRLVGVSAEPTVELLAPGLALYHVASGATGLEDQNHRVLVSVRTVTTKARRLAAPKIRSLRYDHRFGAEAREELVAQLAVKVPTTAVAMVIASVDGTPRSWGPVSAGASTIKPYLRSGCGTVPNGSITSVVGDKVIAYWIDASGRRSAPSAPIRVGAAK